jgi:hypothetical protein
MPTNRISPIVAMLSAIALTACPRAVTRMRATQLSAANSSAYATPAFVTLPLDSIIRTLGPNVGRGGVNAAPAITSNSYEGGGGHFEWDYSLEFTAPAPDIDVVHGIATHLKELAPLRGVRVTGYTLSGDGPVESFSYAAGSSVGWVSVVALKRRQPTLDHFLVSVREDDRPPR